MDYWFQTDVIQFANGFTNIWPSDVHINVTNHPVVLQKCCQTTRRKMSSAGHLSKIIRMAMDKFQYFQCPNVESNRRWRKPTQVSDLKMVSFIPGFGKNFPCFPTHVPTCFAVLPCVSKFVRPAWFRDWNNVKKISQTLNCRIVGLWSMWPDFTLFDEQNFDVFRALGPGNSKVWCGSNCRFHVKVSTIYKIAKSHMSNSLRKCFWDLRSSHFFSIHTAKCPTICVYVYNTTVGWDVPSPSISHITILKISWVQSNRGCTCEHLGHGENNGFGTAG